MVDLRSIAVAGLCSLAVGCASSSASEIVAAGGATVDDGGGTAVASVSAVPEGVLDLMRDLPTYPREMQRLHELSERMHIQASECADFANEERAQLAKFDELSERRADREEAARELAPLMDAVRNAVIPNLVSKLKACREAQRGSVEDVALDALMQACFGMARADFPVSGPSGSTAYGDPLRMPSPQAFKSNAACSEAANQIEAMR